MIFIDVCILNMVKLLGMLIIRFMLILFGFFLFGNVGIVLLEYV